MKLAPLFLIIILFFSCNSHEEDARKLALKDSLASVLPAGQIYTGRDWNGREEFTCALKILDGNNFVLVGSADSNTTYFEQRGKIVAIKDSIYQLCVNQFFFAGPFEDPAPNDTLRLFCDSTLDVSALSFHYADGSVKDMQTESAYINYAYDKKLFNPGHERLGIDIAHLNPVTKRTVLFQADYGSGYEISYQPLNEYYFVSIKGNRIESLPTHPMETGTIVLKLNPDTPKPK
ncbi:MAG: hypothetical protein ACHQRM_12445 [Bacteroidia bacterium]